MWIAKQEGGCGSRLHEEIRPPLRTCARQMKDMFRTTKSRIPMDAALQFAFFFAVAKKMLDFTTPNAYNVFCQSAQAAGKTQMMRK